MPRAPAAARPLTVARDETGAQTSRVYSQDSDGNGYGWLGTAQRSADSVPVNQSDLDGRASRKPASLSKKEKEALDDKANGRPYDRKAYNSAKKKLEQAEKYAGSRNGQKNRSQSDSLRVVLKALGLFGGGHRGRGALGTVPDPDPPERVTLWTARSSDEAIERAEAEAAEYCEDLDGVEYAGLAQSFRLFGSPGDGAEVFSLMRESTLPPGEYVERYFATGEERTG